MGRWRGGFAAARTAAEVDQRSRLRHGNFHDHARGGGDPTAPGPWPSRTPRMVGVTIRGATPFRVPATDPRVVRGVSPAHASGRQPGAGRSAQAHSTAPHSGGHAVWSRIRLLGPPTSPRRDSVSTGRKPDTASRIVQAIAGKPLSFTPLWGISTVPNGHHRLVASPIGRPSPLRKGMAVVGEWMRFRRISASWRATVPRRAGRRAVEPDASIPRERPSPS